MKKKQIVVYIPIYNEIENFELIRRNILKFRKIIPDVRLLFSDNFSSDGTWEALNKLRSEFGQSISLLRNEKNVGFSHNLLSLTTLDDETIVILFGANDEVYTPGLRMLYSDIISNDVDLYMCNWAYVEKKQSKRPVIQSFNDVPIRFQANTLEEFFLNTPYVPNGIMQYVAKARVLKQIPAYTHLTNPQIGIFFNAFPCRFTAPGNPPLALVNFVESTGWRSSVESILNSHLILTTEVLEHLVIAKKRGQLSERIYKYIRNIYLAVPINMYLELWVFPKRGKWGISVSERYRWAGAYFKGIFRLSNLFENSAKVRAVLVRIMFWRVALKVAESSMPRFVYDGLKSFYTHTVRRLRMKIFIGIDPVKKQREIKRQKALRMGLQ